MINSVDVFEMTVRYQEIVKEYKSLWKIALVSGLGVGSLITFTIMLVVK